MVMRKRRKVGRSAAGGEYREVVKGGMNRCSLEFYSWDDDPKGFLDKRTVNRTTEMSE